MPYSVRVFTGPDSEWLLYPSFRKTTFDDSPAIVLMSTHLRQAWTALPGEDVGAKAIASFIKANNERNEEQRKAVPQNPDSNDIHTPWRDSIYFLWNHVFYDIANFLVEVGPGIGDLHPPAHEVLAVNYPDPATAAAGVGAVEDEAGVTVVWKTNVLVLPAHLDSKVALRVMEVAQGGRETKPVGKFDGSNSAEIWFFMEGTEIRIFVEGEYERDRRGVAAVLVYGRLSLHESNEGEDDEPLEDAEE